MANPLPQAVYGGDEISAVVIDPGSTWTRAGFAGEDSPKAAIPTFYGREGDKIYVGDNDLHTARPGMEIASPMEDGCVADWDMTVKIWDYALSKRLYTDAKEHPLLVTEPSWNPSKNREKAAEIAFEQFGVPAFYLAKEAVCSAFACGKPTALVVDIGSAVASVTPVIDGLVLKKASFHSNFAGDYVNLHLKNLFRTKEIELTPHFMVSRKQPVEPGQPAQATLRVFDNITPSFIEFERGRILNEFKESTSQVLDLPYTEAGASTRPVRSFEFPDGYNLVFGNERFTTTEPLFQPQLFPLDGSAPATTQSGSSPDGSGAHGITELITASIAACDVDARANLVNNVVLIGGTSLLTGCTERANADMTRSFPGMKIRIQAPGNSSERKFAGWIGGSILASLGTFHQMWIGKKEYEEVGAVIVEKRCICERRLCTIIANCDNMEHVGHELDDFW
ncbi:actin family [Lipomyces oligophaga]|uniref:actin family n=1 Tax=Lipomyces oligophaga TaxID=45792 RepID=UPI0034CF6F7A